MLFLIMKYMPVNLGKVDKAHKRIVGNAGPYKYSMNYLKYLE